MRVSAVLITSLIGIAACDTSEPVGEQTPPADTGDGFSVEGATPVDDGVTPGEGAAIDTSLPCETRDDLDAVTDVLHAGVPAYDYSAADDLVQLADWTGPT